MDTSTILILLLVFVAASVFAGVLWRYGKSQSENGRLSAALEEKQAQWQNETQRVQSAAAEWRDKYERSQEEKEEAQKAASGAAARAEMAEQYSKQYMSELEKLRERDRRATEQVSRLETELHSAQTQADEKIAYLKKSEARQQAEFKTLAQEVLEEKSRAFDKRSQEALKPLRDNLEQFRHRVDTIYGEETRERAALKNEIQNLQNNAAKIGDDAANLTRALRGDKKMQGDWGEIALLRLLEDSGLRKDTDYVIQPSLPSEDGRKQRPDVVINLPDKRHLIVDSKVSLVDYMDAVAADDESVRTAAIKRHVEAVRRHITDLSERHYQNLDGMNAPDFVFMFMPQEPAFFAALNADRQLFLVAYNKKIILCAPTTLMAVLRTVERIWQLERQNKNAEEIAKRGGALYDKLCGFMEDMVAMDKALGSARAAYDDALKKIKTGNGNVLSQAEKLREMGVRHKKQLSAQQIDRVERE